MCCTGAKWKREVVQDHKFDFVDVHEYHTTGFFTRLRYTLVYVFVIKSVLVYISDIYTGIAMLANGHWAGNILAEADDSKAISVPFSIGKWIFIGCIIFSFLLLAWESRKARMIIRSRDISYAFTNVMANNYYTMKSYDHFCFFSQIDNSKKKKDEFAFFVFFTFKGWKRLLLADAPRQVINSLTLYSFGKAFNFTTDLSKYYNDEDGNFSFVRAGVLCTMIFTVVMWAGSAILLTIAAVMYVPLLCYIQGNLKEYCCHKIDKRIAELMKRKTKKRVQREQELAKREAAGDFRHLKDNKGRWKEGHAPLPQPTLPTIDLNDAELYGDGKSEAGHSFKSGAGGAGYRPYGSEAGGYNSNNYPPVPTLPDTNGYPRYQLSDGGGGGTAGPYGQYAYPSTNTLPQDSASSLVHGSGAAMLGGGMDDRASIKSRDPLLSVRSGGGEGDISQSTLDLNRAPSYRTHENGTEIGDEDEDAYYSQMQAQFGNEQSAGASTAGPGGGGGTAGAYGQYHYGDQKQRASPQIGASEDGTPRQYQQGYFEPDPNHPYAEPPYAMSPDNIGGRFSPQQQHLQQQQHQQQQANPYSAYASRDSNALPYHQSNPPSRSHTPSRSRDLMAQPSVSLGTARSLSPQQQMHVPQQQQQQQRYPQGRGVSLAGRSEISTLYYPEDRDRRSVADSQHGAFDLDDDGQARMSAMGLSAHHGHQQYPGYASHGPGHGHGYGQGQQNAGPYWQQPLDMLDEAEEEVDEARAQPGHHLHQHHQHQQQQQQRYGQGDGRRR